MRAREFLPTWSGRRSGWNEAILGLLKRLEPSLVNSHMFYHFSCHAELVLPKEVAEPVAIYEVNGNCAVTRGFI